jgi:hypothetical protein
VRIVLGRAAALERLRYIRQPGNSMSIVRTSTKAIVLLMWIAIAVSLAGCTYVAIEGPEYQATILTFTPTGNSTQFEGVLTGKGRVSLNRELGGAEGLVEEAGSIINPLGSNEL